MSNEEFTESFKQGAKVPYEPQGYQSGDKDPSGTLLKHFKKKNKKEVERQKKGLGSDL